MTDDEIRQLISDRIELQQAKQTESQKEVAYYGALIGAWINTRFEFDKSLLTLSGAGIGLIVTLMTTFRVTSERIFIAYLIASFAFIASILLLFWVFNRNADHVTKVLKNPSITDSFLKNLDRGAFICFMIGVLSLSFIGVVSGREQIKKEADMAKTKEVTPMGVTRGPRQGGVDPERQQNSLEGIGQLNPKPVPDVRPKPIEPAKPATTQTGGSGTEKK